MDPKTLGRDCILSPSLWMPLGSHMGHAELLEMKRLIAQSTGLYGGRE